MSSLHLLLAIFGLTAVTMTFGSLQELMTWRFQGQPENKTLLPFWLGFIPHVLNWSIIVSYFFDAVRTGDPPRWVWSVIFIQIFTDSLFAINMYLQQKVGSYWI